LNFKKGDLVRLKKSYSPEGTDFLYCRNSRRFDFKENLIFVGFGKTEFCKLFSTKKLKLFFSQKEGIYKF